jgi:hypothetical protein
MTSTPITEAEAALLANAAMRTVARFLVEQGNSGEVVRALFGACVGAYVMGAGKEAALHLLAKTAENVGRHGDDMIEEFDAFVRNRKGTVQ